MAEGKLALMSGELLPPAQLKQMLTTVPIRPENPVGGPGYGLGIMKVPTPCGLVWSQDGGLPGYFSINFTDSTGEQTAGVLVSEYFVSFGPDPELTEASQNLQDAVTCAMTNGPIPSAPGKPVS